MIVFVKLNLKKNRINNMEKENIFFNPGDVVQLKQNIPNKPKMVVIKKVTSIFKHDLKKQEDSRILLGIKCMWFTTNGEYQEQIFNTKDLEIIK